MQTMHEIKLTVIELRLKKFSGDIDKAAESLDVDTFTIYHYLRDVVVTSLFSGYTKYNVT